VIPPSVNFYQLCVAAIKASRGARQSLSIHPTSPPTDTFLLASPNQWGLNLVTLDTDGSGGPGAVEIESEFERVTASELAKHLNDDVAMVTLQAINYRSGARQDLKAITDLVRQHGGLVVWDCSHAAGSIQLDFEKNGVDLAVGCTYKYGNSGPGSPAWLFVSKSIQTELRVPIQGWFAQEMQFEMGPDFEPADTIRRYQIASPSIIGIRAVEVAYEMIERAGIALIEQKAARGTELMMDLFKQWLEPLGFEVASPSQAALRGGHIILTHPDARQIAIRDAEDFEGNTRLSRTQRDSGGHFPPRNKLYGGIRGVFAIARLGRKAEIT